MRQATQAAKGNGVGGGECKGGGGMCGIVTLNPAVGLETHTNSLVTQPQNIATGRRRTAPGEDLCIPESFGPSA